MQVCEYEWHVHTVCRCTVFVCLLHITYTYMYVCSRSLCTVCSALMSPILAVCSGARTPITVCVAVCGCDACDTVVVCVHRPISSPQAVSHVVCSNHSALPLWLGPSCSAGLSPAPSGEAGWTLGGLGAGTCTRYVDGWSPVDDSWLGGH